MKRFILLLLALCAAPSAFAQFNVLIDGNFPVCTDTNGQHLNWNGNFPGGGPVCGTSAAPASPPAISAPNSRTLSFSTAYQASNNALAATVNINLTSTATLSLSGGTTNSATVYIGSTTGVASGTGTAICNYSNSNTGTLTIGLNLSTISAVPCQFTVPSGWYFAILQTSGTVTITSAFDQSIG